ncbi:MAG: deoxynucleoside kinase [Bacteroidetes bacterium]|nr:deoxynucleoside kinase [Bacteroidota bacterium]
MFICIEGNIGSGKSTLAQALAKKLKATYLPEQFEENTLLPLFYSDNKTFAFPTEYSFLIDRQKQLSNYFKAVKKNTTTVSDFHFDKCVCFANANLSSKDFSFFKKHFKPLRKTIPTPDLVVYLDTSTSLLMKNIDKRGRTIEKKLKKNYLEKLKKSLDRYYMADGKVNTIVLILTINEYNSTTLDNCCKEIIEIVQKLVGIL